jgi:hypothetical protein
MLELLEHYGTVTSLLRKREQLHHGRRDDAETAFASNDP